MFKYDDDLIIDQYHLYYRPISLLPNFNRTFEKLVYSKMITFVQEYELFYQAQYGFRKSHSTHNMQ